MKEILQSAGYTTIEAVDGEDALRQFGAHRDSVALLLLDVVMPKRNGKEVYDEIRKMRPDIKVLFTSGYTRDVVIDKGFSGGDFHFVQKPLSPTDLLLKVREAIE